MGRHSARNVAAGGPDGRRALARAIQTNHPTTEALAHVYFAFIHLLSGDMAGMADEGAAAAHVGQQTADRIAECAGCALRAWALSRMGDHRGAAESMTQSEALATELGGTAIADLLLTIQAELALNAGHAPTAEALCERAVSLANAVGGRWVA